ncbi:MULTISPECIES: hypothetical protein [Nocardioides]|uniref:hypothetical protein n=1 Tax=Nocardioides TaxID=1839 RepID=UPI0018E03931|nr:MULTISPECIES: hypothetical protein [unclassified Nocardioides]
MSVVSPQPIVEAGVVALLSQHRDRIEFLPAPLGGGDAAGEDVADEPDVVLYDAIGMLDGDGDDLDYLVDHTKSHVLVISHDLRPDLASRALQRGCAGLLLAPRGSGGAPDRRRLCDDGVGRR